MIVRRHMMGILLIYSFWMQPCSTANAEDFRDSERYFSLKLPDAWGSIPADRLSQVNAFVKERMPASKIRYSHGFQLRHLPPMAYPYILVQPITYRTANPTYEQVEAEISMMDNKKILKKVEGSFSDIAKNVDMSTLILDRSTNRIFMRTEMDVTGIGKVKGISTGFLGSRGIVMVHCYAVDSEFDRYFSDFRTIGDSFRYDPGYEFVPRNSSSSSNVMAWLAVVAAVGVGVLVVLAAGICLLIRMLMNSNPASGSRPSIASVSPVFPGNGNNTQYPPYAVAEIVEVPGAVVQGQSSREEIDRGSALIPPGQNESVQQGEVVAQANSNPQQARKGLDLEL
jgi:hypothetical protein